MARTHTRARVRYAHARSVKANSTVFERIRSCQLARDGGKWERVAVAGSNSGGIKSKLELVGVVVVSGSGWRQRIVAAGTQSRFRLTRPCAKFQILFANYVANERIKVGTGCGDDGKLLAGSGGSGR